MFCLDKHNGQGFFPGCTVFFVHECRECSVSALLSFQWCGCWFWLEWCLLLYKVLRFFFCRHFCPSGITTTSFCGTFFFPKIAGARETLSSMKTDVNTVIVAWTEGRGHLSNKSEGKHCAEGGLIMERDDIEAGRKWVVWQVMCSEVTLPRSPQA